GRRRRPRGGRRGAARRRRDRGRDRRRCGAGPAAGLTPDAVRPPQRDRLHPGDLLAVHHDAAAPDLPGVGPGPATSRRTGARAVHDDRRDDSAVLHDVRRPLVPRGSRPALGPRGRCGEALRPRGVTMTTTALIAAGGYSRSGSGRGPGIELLGLSIEEATGAPAVLRLATVDLPDPSFVLWSRDGSVLHAVLETDPTRVVAVRVSSDGREAEVIGDLTIDGSGGCHRARGTDSSTLVVAQYGAGTVATVRLDDDGVPVEQIDLDDHRHLRDGDDTSSDGPHPHQVVALRSEERRVGKECSSGGSEARCGREAAGRRTWPEHSR